MKKKFIRLGIIIGFCLLFPTVFTLFFNRNTVPPADSLSSGKNIIINTDSDTIKMDLEDFIPCVLVNQLSIDAPNEALKAQAVVVRTYILNLMKNNTDINADELSLPFTLYDDLKNIAGKQYTDYYTKLKNATNDTFGQTIKYNGNTIIPYFHSVSSGYTRNGNEALASNEFPYLTSKESPYDTSADNYLTIVYIDKTDFINSIKKYNENITLNVENPLETYQVLARCNAGYISQVQIGNINFTGDEIQKIFSLSSPYFEIENYENQIRIICKGVGHGLGLSIFGSIAMACEGKNYIDILTYYYSGITIE